MTDTDAVGPFGPRDPALFHRELTLRILIDGRIYREDVTKDGNDLWTLECVPQL